MKSYPIKIQQPGQKLDKEEQLAWRIASMASQDWNLTSAISEMVGNRITVSYTHLTLPTIDRV